MNKNNTKGSVLLLFIKNLFLLFIFRGLGVLTTVIVTIMAGRALSIEEMGQFNLIFSLSNVIVIPLVMGVNNTLLKILPEAEEEKRQEILGTVIIGNIGLCLIVSVTGILISPVICRILNISYMSWYLAIFLAIITNICIITETVLKTNEKFTQIGIARVIGSVILFGSYMICILAFHTINCHLFVSFNIIGQVTVFFISLYKFEKVKFRFDSKIAGSVFKISVMYMFSWLLIAALNYADVYIISAMRNTYEVGIFSGYQTNVRNYFSVFYNDIFAAVMLPTLINHNADQKRLVKTVLKFLPVIFLIISSGTIVVILGLLFAFGKKYPIIWPYILIEAAGIGFQGIYYFFNSLLITEGKMGAKDSLSLLAKPFVLLITIMFLGTKYLGILGTFLSFTINQAILAALLVSRYYKRIVKNNVV